MQQLLTYFCSTAVHPSKCNLQSLQTSTFGKAYAFLTEILQRARQKDMVESKGCLNPSRVHSKSPLCLTAYEMLWTQFPVSVLKTGSATVCIGCGRDSPGGLLMLPLSSGRISYHLGTSGRDSFWLSWPEENGKSLGTYIKQVHTSPLPLVYSSVANTNGVLPTFPSKSWTENFN